MYTTLETREVETFGALETRDFSIKASGKAFKILINNLYADKPLAVTRELWSNAYDSHAAAGKSDVPFDVNLPTEFEPHFSVRDYGVSMTHEQVMSVYTRLFESSKENDNDSVGKLGLGCKSPFAYTDTFMLCAWLNGEKRIYNAYINEQSIPTIMHVSTEPSDEPQGVEVSFPVRPDDAELFEAAARRVVRGFRCIPRFTGAEIEIAPRVVALEDPTGEKRWELLTGDAFIRNRAHALQGCVIYPIDVDAVADLTAGEKAILQLPLLIDFPIGQLDITPSRESLSYDEHTQRNIREMAQKITHAITDTYVKQIASETTYWKACQLYQTLIQTATHIPGLDKILGDKTTFRGRQLKQRISLDNIVQRYNSTVRSMGGLQVTKVEAMALTNTRRAPKWEPTSYCNVNPKTDTVVFENIHESLQHVGPRLQYAHDCGLIKYGAVLWVKADPDSAAWKRLFVYLGRPDVIYVNNDNLPRRPVVPGGRGVRTKTRMKTIDFKQQAEVEALVDPQGAHFYVMKERNLYKRELMSDTRYVSHICSVRNALVKVGAMSEADEIVIIPMTHKKKANRPGWRDLYKFAHSVVSEKLNVREISRGLALELYLSGLDDVGGYLKERLRTVAVSPYAPGSAADKYLQFIRDCEKRFTRRDMQIDMRTLASEIRHPKLAEIKSRAGDIDDEAYQKAFAEAYPIVDAYIKSNVSRYQINQELITKIDHTINALDTMAVQVQGGTDDAQQSDDIAA